MAVQGRVTKDGRKFPGRLEISLEAIAMPGKSAARDVLPETRAAGCS